MNSTRRAFFVACLAATPVCASAAVGDTATLVVHGVIPAKCGFSSVPGATDLGELQTARVSTVGPLAFRCNLATSGPVSLTVRSQNGGLKRDGGTEQVAYEAAWNIQGLADSFVTLTTAPIPFSLSSGVSGVEQSGAFKIRVTGATDALVAGTYRDTITYTISP
jgi:spore coat protein U-like protein